MEIRRMSPGEMDAACKVVGLAFAENPNTLAVVKGDRGKAKRMMEVAARAAKLGRKYSFVLVAADEGRIVGVLNAAEWPNCQLSTSEKLSTAPSIIRVTGSGVLRSLKMMTVWAKHDPRQRHWHLGPIGVDPGVQGRGVGTALLSSFLETVDDQRSPSYLETDVDRNVTLYERFGFRIVAHEEINGVSNRFMWRDAAIR